MIAYSTKEFGLGFIDDEELYKGRRGHDPFWLLEIHFCYYKNRFWETKQRQTEKLGGDCRNSQYEHGICVVSEEISWL